MNSPVDRRRALRLLGGSTALGLTTAAAACSRSEPSPAGSASTTGSGTAVAFDGEHQAGVLTQPPRLLTLMAFDLKRSSGAREDLRRLLRLWTDTARRLMAGAPGLADLAPELGADPSSLTVTVGLGAGALQKAGLSDKAPGWLKPLPHYTIDRLQTRWNDGDIVLQLCCDAELPLAHATRLLTTDASDFASVRWTQKGFRSASEGTQNRNLFGQVDGTINPTVAEADELVWIGGEPSSRAWLNGGSSMVVRRIEMNLAKWEQVDRDGREASIGRNLVDGAPLTGGKPSDQVDFSKVDAATGFTVVLPAAHARRAVTGDPAQRILRRPFNYDDGTGSGLVFIAFQKDPVKQYVPIQNRLARLDLLNLWTTPVGSSVFAVLPGCRTGSEFLGQALFR